MLIDTHCHLDAAEFDQDRLQVIEAAHQAGVKAILIPSVAASNFKTVRELAHAMPGGAYALGIHPMYVHDASSEDLVTLREAVSQNMGDPRLVAIGEIGLDFFVPDISTGDARERQERFFAAQLDLALEFGLPVLLHVRRSQDALLKHLRKRPRIGGIAHAFNGSLQQAQAFVALGFKLGFGGALTYDRALQLRRLATTLPPEALVLETDAPDIPPHWLYVTAEQRAQGQPQGRNTPAELPRIAAVLAQLRGCGLPELAAQTHANACAALPRLGALLAP